MLYVYRRSPSDSATDLAEALDGKRWRARTVSMADKARAADVIVCWGESFPTTNIGIRVLNGAPRQNKFEDALKLRAAGVATVEVSRTRPPATQPGVAAADPAFLALQRAQELANAFTDLTVTNPVVRSAPLIQGVTQLYQSIGTLSVALRAPVPVAPPAVQVTWLGRMFHHVGGNDLLNPPATPDYFVKKENLIQEFRIHSFLGKSIRAGHKVPKPEGTPHAWVRSMDGGWKISYDGVTSRQRHRDIAHRAITALGLDFGAVDIGQKADGSLIVLEVNRAPGIKQGTIDCYVNAIGRWVRGDRDEVDEA